MKRIKFHLAAMLFLIAACAGLFGPNVEGTWYLKSIKNSDGSTFTVPYTTNISGVETEFKEICYSFDGSQKDSGYYAVYSTTKTAIYSYTIHSTNYNTNYFDFEVENNILKIITRSNYVYTINQYSAMSNMSTLSSPVTNEFVASVWGNSLKLENKTNKDEYAIYEKR